jgi:hypothetical protein
VKVGDEAALLFAKVHTPPAAPIPAGNRVVLEPVGSKLEFSEFLFIFISRLFRVPPIETRLYVCCS